MLSAERAPGLASGPRADQAGAQVIPPEVIEEIRERTDLVSLIGEYVRLKKTGASFKGLCPFHSEKTPSFHVNPARGFYHCFGCKASGDCFKFYSALEGVSFGEAARQLAARAGVEIPESDSRDDRALRDQRKREGRLKELLDLSAGFFMRQVEEHRFGEMAREAWRARGIRDEVAAKFRLGYAPDVWDALSKYLGEQGYSLDEMERVGLVLPRRSGRGFYDRFRHRLVFPIADHHGRVVAFSARELPPSDPEEDLTRRREPGPKYINSPEGPLYTKGKILYGLHEGRVEVRRAGWVLVCEGNFDLVALHQAGFGNSVAPMGTALTPDQVKLLKRFAEKVVLLFDGDKAGLRAVVAAEPILRKAGLETAVVTLPAGADPDSFLREHGAKALHERIEAAPSVIDHLIETAAAQAGADPEAVGRAITELGPPLSRIENPITRRLYVERVAQRFGVRDLEAVRTQLLRGVRAANQEGRGRRSGRRDARPAAQAAATSAGARPHVGMEAPPFDPGPSAPPPFDPDEAGYDGYGAESAPGPGPERVPERQPPVRPPRPFRASLESEMLGALLDHPSLFASAEAQQFGELLTDTDLRAIFLSASRMQELRGSMEAPALLAELQEHGMMAGTAPEGRPGTLWSWLEGRLVEPVHSADSAERVLSDGLAHARKRALQRRARELKEAILSARRAGEHERAVELERERAALQRRASLPNGSEKSGQGAGEHAPLAPTGPADQADPSRA